VKWATRAERRRYDQDEDESDCGTNCASRLNKKNEEVRLSQKRESFSLQ
jgi:hypothetical protein